MRHQWTLTTANPDTWLVWYGGRLVAELTWIRDLSHPHLTMGRIADGLNGLHADSADGDWSTNPTVFPERHDICWRGDLVAELAWTRPVNNPDMWVARVMAGLNWRSAVAGHVGSQIADTTPRPPLRSVS